MKQFALYLLSLLLGVTVASAQELHYSYRYTGTTYKAEGGGETTMTNKISSARLKSSFIASILPDHKTIWIYSSTINERCTGKGIYKNGGYQYSLPISAINLLELMYGELPEGSYSLFLPANNSRIICSSLEERGKEYFVTRYDHYTRQSAVSKPNNPRRTEIEQREAKERIESQRRKVELAAYEAERKAEQVAFEKRLKSSVGKEFPMAYFIDSYGNRVDASFFKRGKKTLVYTTMVGCQPTRNLQKELEKYPHIAEQIITIYFIQTKYSECNIKNHSNPNKIFFNSSEGNNSSWIYGRTCPYIILLDEYGKVISYKSGYSKEKDPKYIAKLVEKMRIRTYAPYKVGDYYFDGKNEGVVFEVYNNGYSGKIVSLNHSDKVKRWRETGSLDIGKTFGVTDGRDIMYYRKMAESITGDDAFGWCYRMGSDWYLPTIEELKSIYKNRSLIEPKLKNRLDRYWSSTEYSAEKAYCIEKDNGYVWSSEKHYGCRIRAVKSFGKDVPRAKQKQTSAPYKVGDFYNENNKKGIVFEVNADGTSGKIVDIHPWGNNAWTADNQLISNIIGANSKTDGQYNTNVIMRTDDWEKKYPAFEYCTRYIDKGWYIPSINELKSIYNAQRSSCIRLSKGVVWSSTEYVNNSNINALTLDLHTGKSSTKSKGSKFYIYTVAPFGKPAQIEKRTIEPTSAPYKVGDLYNDGAKCGVVVEVWDEGRSGKIISLTETLQPLNDAKATCTAMGEGWYLPSIDELRLLSYNGAEAATINEALKSYGAPLQSDTYYWSSTLTGNTIHGDYPTAYTVTMDRKYNTRVTCNGYYVRGFALFGSAARPTTTLARPKTCGPYKIGDYYNDGVKDGIVFMVSAGGHHGKIVSLTLSEIGNYKWTTNSPEKLIGAKSKSDGAKNMAVVKSQPNWRQHYPLFAWCESLGSQWYIPAIKELEAIYTNRGLLRSPLVSNKYIWYASSTESSKNSAQISKNAKLYKENCTTALGVDISNGFSGRDFKWNNYTTRAVAKF